VLVDRAIVAAATSMLKVAAKPRTNNIARRSGRSTFRPGSFSPVVNGNDSHTLTASLNTELRSFLKYWLPLLTWLGVIFIGSTGVLSAEQTSRFLVPFLRWLDPQISIATILSIHFALRKLGHLIEYAILAALLWRALRGTLTSTRNLAIASVVFVVSALFAASDEFHQSFIPSRTASSKDVMIDICGTLVGLFICWIFGRARRAPRIF
jgi:VanZ family protein